MDATALAEGLRSFFGPLLFALLGIAGAFAVLKGQATRLVQLVALAVAVSVLLYQPTVVRGMGEAVAALLPDAEGGW